MPPPVLLAAYGTLMTGQRNGLDPAIRARMRRARCCRIAGRLYEVREPDGAAGHLTYPALVPAGPGEAAVVEGEVFAIGADAAEAAVVLAATDRYEACVPDDPQGSTYLRRLHPVLVDGAVLLAWLYLYNRPTDGLRPIPGGRWR